jgi:ERF superfamily protein
MDTRDKYPATLAESLVAFQTEFPTVRKADIAKVKTKTGDNYSYTYADLADVSLIALPLLAKHGLAWSTKPTINAAGKFVLVYRLLHVSGAEDVGEWPLPSAGTPQEYGSVITYARRYALCCVTGIAPSDQDDDGAKGRSVTTERSEPSRDWDPGEQETLYAGWVSEIQRAPVTRIDEIGRALIAAKNTNVLSPDTYNRLLKVGAARRAELKRSVTSAEILETPVDDWSDVTVAQVPQQ